MDISGGLRLPLAVADWLADCAVLDPASAAPLPDGCHVILDEEASSAFEGGAVRRHAVAYSWPQANRSHDEAASIDRALAGRNHARLCLGRTRARTIYVGVRCS